MIKRKIATVEDANVWFLEIDQESFEIIGKQMLGVDPLNAIEKGNKLTFSGTEAMGLGFWFR